MEEAVAVQERPLSAGRQRYWVMLLLLVLVTVNYIDRANLSIAGPEMAKEFGWSLARLGFAFSAMFWVYTPMLLVWGAGIDVIGTRMGYAIGLFIWAVASIATGTINGFGTLLGARWALAIGESVAPPACAKVVREWAPIRDRGWSSGAFTAGYYLGPAVGYPICAWLVSSFGWRTMFFVLGGLTLLFVLLWLAVYWPPERARWLRDAERQLILSERDSAVLSAASPRGTMTRGDVLRHPTTWGLVVAQAVSTYTVYLFLMWLPGYLLHTQHINLMQAGIYSTLPYIVALIACIAYGWFSDRALDTASIDRGGRRRYVLAAMIANLAILLVPAVHNFGLIIALLAVSLAGSGCTLTANVALANDMLVDPRFAGLIFGLLGIGSNIVGLFAPIATGLVAQFTGGFGAAFLIAGTITAAGIACVLLLVRSPITARTYREVAA